MQLSVCTLCLILVLHLGGTDRTDDYYNHDVTVTLGASPIPRDLVGPSHPGRHGVVIPQPITSITSTTVLTNWTLFLRGTVGKVRLQIWRPKFRSSGNGEQLLYELIGQTGYQDVSLQGNGTRTFTEWPHNKLRLAPNDTFGLEFVDANPVPYSVSPVCRTNSSSVVWMPWSSSNSPSARVSSFVPGQQYEFSRTRPPECRLYSVQLKLQTRACKQLRASVTGQVEQVYRPQREDADLCWVVAPSDAAHVVRLQVLQERSLDTPLFNNCSFVIMEIRIGRPAITGNVVYSHCDIEHHEIPFDVSNKEIYIRLVTSANPNYPEQLAISIAFSSKSIDKDCQKVFGDEIITFIQSPGFPSAYPRNQDICWLVMVDTPYRVRVEVQKSELEPSYTFTNDTDGCVDYVEIFDGPLETHPLLARWCGTTDPGMLTGSGNTILIRFYSGPYTVFPGFRLAVWAAVEADTTTCTKLQASADEQFLYSPGYPHSYRSNENVCWELQAANGHRLQIKIYDSSMEGDNLMCEYDVAIIRDGSHSNSPVLRRWCGTMVPENQVLTSGNAAHVSLYSDGSINGQGFYMGFSQIATDACTVYGVYPYTLELSAFRLIDRIPSMACFTLQTELPSFRVRLEIMAPINSDSCNKDYILVFDGTGPDAPLLVRWCRDVTPTYVTSSATSLHVRAVVETLRLEDLVFRFAYLGLHQGKPHLCDGSGRCQTIDVGTTEGYLNSPSSDMNPFITPTWPGPVAVTPPGRRRVTARADPATVRYSPNADACTVLEARAEGVALVLRVMFVQIEGPDDSGQCSNDYLEIRDGNMETSPLLVKQCGERSSFTLVTSGRFAYIRFVSNAEQQFRGFQIRFIANSTQGSGCQLVNVTTSGGLLTSPNYPNPYPSMSDVCWILKAPVSRHIKLSIIEFFVEDGCADFMEVYDGETADSSMMTLICGGGKAPSEITSTGSSLYIRFRSDNGIEYRGFRIEYKTASSGLCHHIGVGKSTTSISSPNWPLSPPRSAEFCWVLTAPGHAERLAVSVSDSDMLTSVACSQDHVQLLDGPLPSSQPILRWCGDDIPADMTTSGRSAYLRLVTSSANASSKGFVITFRSISVSSAVAVDSLKANMHWVIIALIAGVVLLTIVVCLICYSYKRRKMAQQSPPSLTSPQTVNSIYDVPSIVRGAHAPMDITPPDVAPVESKSVRLNPDGSASFSTAFENPGYAELPATT